jgi:hypothetical protein
MPSLLRLSDYPYARLTIACGPCGRRGRWSVARLAERHGADITLHDLLPILTATCKWQRKPGDPPPRAYEPRCCARFPDLAPGPEEEPAPERLRVIDGGRG